MTASARNVMTPEQKARWRSILKGDLVRNFYKFIHVLNNKPAKYSFDCNMNILLVLQWRHNGRNGVSNHRRIDCLLNRFSGADQTIHQGFASLAFMRGFQRWPVNSVPVTWICFPFDDIIMKIYSCNEQDVCLTFLWSQHEFWVLFMSFGASCMTLHIFRNKNLKGNQTYFLRSVIFPVFMMMSSNAFSALLALYDGDWPVTKTSETVSWCFLWFVPEQTAE